MRVAPAAPEQCPARKTAINFQETHWSVVMRACAGSNDALQHLAEAYWPAVYAFLRRKGFAPPDAEDITQHTFTRLLNFAQLSPVDPAKGRFRSYLRACAEHEASHLR